MKNTAKITTKSTNVEETIVSSEAYYRSINHFMFFMMNYPRNFMEAFGHEGNELRELLEDKFKKSYHEAGSRGAMTLFYFELDSENRENLVQWCKDNYVPSL